MVLGKGMPGLRSMNHREIDDGTRKTAPACILAQVDARSLPFERPPPYRLNTPLTPPTPPWSGCVSRSNKTGSSSLLGREPSLPSQNTPLIPCPCSFRGRVCCPSSQQGPEAPPCEIPPAPPNLPQSPLHTSLPEAAPALRQPCLVIPPQNTPDPRLSLMLRASLCSSLSSRSVRRTLPRLHLSRPKRRTRRTSSAPSTSRSPGNPTPCGPYP